MRRVVLVLCALALVLAGTACRSKDLAPLPPPPTTVPRPPTTAEPDYNNAALEGVPGKTTTTIAMGPGRSTLRGVVNGPDGPVAGATVRAERLVGSGVGFAQVFTAPDGTWSINGVFGGRYRVRAWRPSDLALTKPEVFFLDDGDTKQFTIGLQRYTGLAVTHAVAPDPPFIGEPTNLVVQVVQQSVDDNGIVRGSPVPNVRVELVGRGEWAVQSSNPTVTNAQGRATWEVRCRASGKQELGVVVAGADDFPLDISPCTEPPEEPEPTTSSTAPDSSTSSTEP